MTFRDHVLKRFDQEFGQPSRQTIKVIEWTFGHDASAVVQLDQPAGAQAALIWLPYPADGEAVPEIALEYPAEAGRHSNTYAAPGLRRGVPALRLTVSSLDELAATVAYIKAMREARPLPEVKAATRPEAPMGAPESYHPAISANGVGLPEPKPMAPRREAIPRVVQREVWQRDGGRCVECGTREKLCFDHIVPFSRGGSNTVRNVQLLCEHCNSSKGNRI